MTRSLERLAAEATSLAGGDHQCALLGHQWKFIGCMACCCNGEGECSLPVHECEACGDCDYGENQHAEDARADCALRAS